MKRDKLYTVNKWNMPAFMKEQKNLYGFGGGDINSLVGNQSQASGMYRMMGQYNSPGITNDLAGYLGGGGGSISSGGGKGSSGKGSGGGGMSVIQAAPGIGRGIQAAFQDKPQYSEDAHNGFSTVDTALTGGKKSKIGTALVNGGASYMNSALSSGDFKGALYAGIAGTVGTIINNAAGVKVDEDRMASNLQGQQYFDNYRADASTLDEVPELQSMVTFKNPLTGGVFNDQTTNNWKLRERYQDAKSFAQRYQLGNMHNIIQDNMNNQLRYFSAFGGPLDKKKYAFGGSMFGLNGGVVGLLGDVATAGEEDNSYSYGGFMDNNNIGALGYSFMDRYLTAKEGKQAQNSNMTNMFAGSPNSMFAIGGDLQTSGSDFSSGLVHVDAGGQHETNPYDGVQMGVDSEGTPNLVEEGEVVYNDYVYSNRIPVDMTTKEKFHLPKKKEITYADLAKKLEKEISERPNDPLSQAGFKAQMEQLEEQQERQKQEMEAERAKAAFEALSPEEQTALMQQKAEQEAMAQQAMQQEAMAAQQQPTPEELAMAQQAQMQANGSQAMVGQEPQFAEGGHLFVDGGNKKKNAGTWKSGDSSTNWAAYTKNGLRDYLLMINDELENAETDAEKKAIREKAIKTVNDIQKAYSEAYQANLTPSEKNKKVEALQKAFQEAGGNAYFSNIANNINLPKGHNTEDTEEKGWVDGYWGPRTSIRNWGSTEYGDANYYQDLVDLASQAGLTYAPGEYKYGDNTLYQLGLAPEEAAVEQPVAEEPVMDENPDLAVDAAGTPIQELPKVPTTTDTEEKKVVPDLKKESYFGMFGPALGLGLMAAGVGKPDTSGINAAIASANSPAHLAGVDYIGDYMPEKKFDRMFYLNQLMANARATDRGILNSGVNQGSKNAALLANGLNTTIALGNLGRQAEEYQDTRDFKGVEFNRGTNIFNKQAYNQNQQFNAEALNRAKQYSASLGLQGAAQKMDADQWWASNLYGNLGSLFDNIGQWEEWKRNHNTVAKMYANGLAGTVTPNTPVASGFVTNAACGGKMKKKKRGLTF